MRAFLLTTTAITVLIPNAARAQATAAPATAPSSTAKASEISSTPSENVAAADQAASTQGLGEIIVTAQRRSETLQRAAVAVDVVQGSDLIAAGVTQIDRLDHLAPALTVQRVPTGSVIFIRGVGNFTVSPNSDPAIAFNYDGVYVARSSSTVGVFFDLDRVEVLKGPQGTLYGRNATGGAINVLPTQPKIGELSAYATASYGNYNAVTAEGAVNAPMGENGAVRVSASIANHDGYLKDGTTDDKTKSLRVQMKARLTPDLTVRIAGDYSHQGGAGSTLSYLGNYLYDPAAGKYNFIPSNLPISEGEYTDAAQAYRQTVPVGTAGRNLDALTPYAYQHNNFFGSNAEIAYDTGAGVLTIIPAWRYSSLDYLSAASFAYKNREKDEQFSVEARFEGKRIGIFDYTIGAYYFHETINAHTELSLSSLESFIIQRYRTDSYAPFGRLTAHLSDKLRLVGGIRYTDDKKRFAGTTTNGVIVCLAPACPGAPLFPIADSPAQLPFPFPQTAQPFPQVVPGFFIPGVPFPTGLIIRTDASQNPRLSNNKITYRAAVEYDVAPRSLLYASYETGYRSGGFSTAVGFETYQPEYITAYTIGLKNRFFDNRVQLNIEGFYWRYRNQQVNHVGLDLTGQTANFTQNIGSSRIKGVEVEGRVLITPTSLVSADVQYLDARNRSFVYQAPVGTPGTPPPLVGCGVSLSNDPTLYNVDCSGKQSYNSPKWTVNLSAEQTVPLGDYKFVAGADTQYKSKRDIGFQYLAAQTIHTHWSSNAQIAFGPADDHWSISGFVHNVENHRTPIYSSLHPTANILIDATTAPRTYGVRASVKF